MSQVPGNVRAVATEAVLLVEDGRAEELLLAARVERPVPVGLTELLVPAAGPERLFVLGQEQAVVRVEDSDEVDEVCLRLVRGDEVIVAALGSGKRRETGAVLETLDSVEVGPSLGRLEAAPGSDAVSLGPGQISGTARDGPPFFPDVGLAATRAAHWAGGGAATGDGADNGRHETHGLQSNLHGFDFLFFLLRLKGMKPRGNTGERDE